MFNLLKRLFFKKHENVVIERRGVNIIIPVEEYSFLKDNDIGITLTFYKNKPSSVQLMKKCGKRYKYYGTLRKKLHVSTFKDNNVCNFSQDNLIKE